MAEQQLPQYGTFAWNELATTDPETCKAFYGTLLGWEASEMPMPDGTYIVFSKNGTQMAGMMKIGPDWGEVPPHWLGYIAVEDVDASAAQVESLGGGIIMPPTDVPGIGRFSVIRDPAGAVVAIMTFQPMEEPQ